MAKPSFPQPVLEQLATHVVFPRHLPNTESPDLHQHELFLIQLMTQTVDAVNQIVTLPTDTVKMMYKFSSLHPLNDPELLSNELNALSSDEMLCAYVRQQNCGLIIYRFPSLNSSGDQPGRYIVSTFPGKLKPEDILGGGGCNNDLQLNYPAQSLKVKWSELFGSTEFAKQLCHFYDKPGKSAQTNYVSKWLVTTLADRSSVMATDDEFPTITKKVRDDVVDSFQRSGFWMAVKVSLQLNLTIKFGKANGCFVYKLIMLKYLTRMCDLFNNDAYDCLDVDLVSQMLVKMARRIEKLAKQLDSNMDCGEYRHLYYHAINQAGAVISKTRQKLDRQIKMLETVDTTASKLSPITRPNFEADIEQKVPKLLSYLASSRSKDEQSDCVESIRYTKYVRHRMHRNDKPTVNIFDNSPGEIGDSLKLTDYENYLLYNVSSKDGWRCGSKELREHYLHYSSRAEQFYKGDPLGSSKMILLRLKFLVMLDQIATDKHKLLLKHNSGINHDIFDNLLLPQHADMEIAFELQKYFQERNENSNGPALIGEDSPTKKSFSVQYATNSEDMQQTRAKLLEMTKKKIQEKRDDWNQKQHEVKQMRRQAAGMSHTYYTNSYGRTYHSSGCSLCCLNEQINGVKINLYERPLPTDEYLQNAVVFELRVPVEIACLRDVLYETARLINTADRKGIDIRQNWTKYNQISSYDQSECYGVYLGSSSQLTLDRRNQPTNLHVDEPFESFIVENGFNCYYYAENRYLPTKIGEQSVKKLCTLKVESGSPYDNLQWTVDGTSHTQNQVLTKQSECSVALALAEYKNFGSLRADGHRMQLRKLFAMIETEALSFETSSVLALIMQTIYETGPIGECVFHRESFVDFIDPTFATEMIKLLDKFIEQQKRNWSHPLKLLSTALIAVRIFDLNLCEDQQHCDVADRADQIANLLMKIREVTIGWMEEIQKSIHESNDNVANEKILRFKLTQVAIAGAATFYVDVKHRLFRRIFDGHLSNGFSALRTWLEIIVTLNNNMLLSTSSSETIHLMFLRLVRKIGINMESKIVEMIHNEPSDVFEFIKSQWSKAQDALFERKVTFENNDSQTLIARNGQNHVTIDIITGDFQVNNQPVAKLPQSITQAALFQRTFGQFVFEVQPETQNSYSTPHTYNGCYYDFCVKSDNTLIITERREHQKSDEKCDGEDGRQYELISHEILKDEIPYLLVENYSHWWNMGDVIEFRPKLFSDDHFTLPNGVQYELNLKSRRLVHLKTQREMLDVSSPSYESIITQLSRLERKEYIHVLMEKPKEQSTKKPTVATIELMRMHLIFEVNATNANANEYDIVSCEFSGMRVSLKQKYGTFFGLNHGLFLESVHADDDSKLLILPHAEVSATANKNHATVNIGIKGELKSPPFYTYRVDDFCQQIVSRVSSYTAWFYLAYLHALSSHGAPEPFTGLTGTERALQILQSSLVWSSSPYDREVFGLLCGISELAPVRKYNRKDTKKKVFWPKDIPTHAAQDVFICIATKLLADSQRLKGLYNVDIDGSQLQEKSNLHLNKDSYLRWLPFYPNLCLSNTFIEHQPLWTKEFEFKERDSSLPNTRTTSVLCQESCQYHVSSNFKLKDFLINAPEIYRYGLRPIDCAEEILNHSTSAEFADVWINLYENSRKQEYSNDQFALIFTLFAHEGQSIGAILALQAVFRHPGEFASINPPNVEQFDIKSLNFSLSEVKKILSSHHSYPSDYCEYTGEMQNTYEKQLNQNIKALTDAITGMWPCDRVDGTIYNHLRRYNDSTKHIKLHAAIEQINPRLLSWNNNRKLLLFIEDVTSKLQELKTGNSDINNFVDWSFIRPIQSNWPKFSIDFESKLCEQITEYEADVATAKEVYTNRTIGVSAQKWWELFVKITHPSHSKHLIDAQMYPRLVKALVLPKLLSSQTNDKLKVIIGAFAITLAHEQRLQRIAILEKQSQMIVHLQREKENQLHSNWFPHDRPEWLLFEIEQNLGIRRIQVEVAKRMIDPPSTRTQHSVMQLNMGEGKTAVIAPILASILSDGRQVCQITILKSLYATNSKSLRQYLGGMLNRRVYHFPCRRDMPVDKCIEQMMEMYEECKRYRGVILTLPEYRLSFQLKTYEMVRKGSIDKAKNFLLVHKWLNSNIRSILDESDAILQAKYQLIYTIGDHMPLNGGAARWTVIQALFKCIPQRMKQLHAMYGDEKIEFDNARTIDDRRDIFPPCRILDDSIYAELKQLLIEDFLNGEVKVVFSEIVDAAKQKIRRILNEKEIDKETFRSMIDEFPTEKQHILLILGGLLRFEVLRLVLTKRWRVNYGVNEKGTRKMAIPFKAKDVAAEMTEFGHTDVALCFTHLSYYYSGLTDNQLRQVFQILATKQNPVEIYEQWIASLPKKLVDVSIQSYSGINLADPKQRDGLVFPLFRYNMYVIDYWLSNAVFPREAKTFEKKLMCTAWDLCSEHLKHKVTGFSGTNDTKNILPLTVTQNDLSELEQTNENVRKTLLQAENQAYESLPANTSGRMILERLANRHHPIPVLLDAGALMLELNNEQVAREWLKLVPSDLFDAAVYFNHKDVLMTINRNDIMCEFDCSVYRDKLDRCLVYLDDAHTRGTDLRFPLNWRACVTLSNHITRDKTVQSCMRMRLLGKGHSIAFWASFEADVRIRELCHPNEGQPSNEHVLGFIQMNSERLEKEDTVHWVAAAFNYTKKLSAHKLHESSDDVEALAVKCYDNEFLTLMEMYGGKDECLLSKISEEKFNKLAANYKDHLDIIGFVDETKTGVDRKIQNDIPDVKRYTGLLDEEQEKELEHESEEERQVERPPPAEPATPNADPRFKQLIRFGMQHSSFRQLKESQTILPVPMSLKNTKMFDFVEGEASAWADHIYATNDFIKVIQGTEYSYDSYLRPVWWIARVYDDTAKDKVPKILFMSSHECNEFMPEFRSSKNAALYMYRPRISQFHDNLLHNPQLCVSAITQSGKIKLADEVQINVMAGAQYFASDKEQEAYCGFMGLIPRKRSPTLQREFEAGLIEPNGFVPRDHRQDSTEISALVGNCEFNKNPVATTIQIIEAHHEYMRTKSHAATILNEGIKATF